MANNEIWMLETFAELVADLKKQGLTEEDAKLRAKVIMNDAVDIVTGKQSLTDILRK